MPWILLAFAFKFFIASGRSFNSRLYDDENSWVLDMANRSSIDYIFHRDLPGYFIIPFRTYLLIMRGIDFDYTSAIRYSVILIQLFCILLFVLSLTSLGLKSKLGLFSILVVIPIEDLNYLHNIGYMLSLPIFALYMASIKKSKLTQAVLGGLAGLLITKPLVALALLLLIFSDTFTQRLLRKKVVANSFFLIVLGLLAAVYLLLYFILPNDFDSPESFKAATSIKVVIQAPWILATAFIPAINIGFKGIVHQTMDNTASSIVGLIVYKLSLVLILALLSLFRQSVNFSEQISNERQDREKQVIALLLFWAYLASFTVSNFAFVTEFPLWKLAYTPRIWMRWSSMIPFLVISLLVIFIEREHRSKFIRHLPALILLQYVGLWSLGHSNLIRWQP